MATALLMGPRDSIHLMAGGTVDGFYLKSKGLTDWYAGAESKSDVNERPQAHGAFGIGNDWSSSVAISVGGVFAGATEAEALHAAARLSALGGGGRKVTMAVTDALGTTSRVLSLRRVGIPDFGTESVFDFALDFIAADPLRYGPELSASTGVPVSGGGLLFPLGTNPLAYWDFGADGSSGRVSIENVGTADVWPDLIVTGGLGGGFVATNVTTGDTVRFERPIPGESVVRINQRTGMASIDGQSDVSGFITVRGFFSVPAGETHQIQFSELGAVTGTPQFTATLSPGYH